MRATVGMGSPTRSLMSVIEIGAFCATARMIRTALSMTWIGIRVLGWMVPKYNITCGPSSGSFRTQPAEAKG